MGGGRLTQYKEAVASIFNLLLKKKTSITEKQGQIRPKFCLILKTFFPEFGWGALSFSQIKKKFSKDKGKQMDLFLFTCKLSKS